MKQGKLIRRAVSAALAGCMMFTLSAPALAESTDALMQLSMTRRSAVSVLDAENSGTDANASVATKYGITIEIYGRGKVEVDSDNCNNILDFLKYDPDEQKLTLLNPSADAVHYLTIDAPNTDVVLESTNMIVNFNLLIENARSVKVSSTGSWAPVYGKVFIYCACPVTLEHTGAGINHGVAISGIEFAAPVNASDFVYYTSNAADAKPTDAGTGTIPASTVNYLRIVPKASYTITADDATITVDGKAVTSVHEGEKVTVTAAGRKNAEFTGWTAEGITLTDKQKVNPTVTFTMPGNNVTLTPNYNVVQDYGLEVGAEFTTPTRVTSKNHKDILGNGVLSYDPTTQTLKSNGPIRRSSLKINAPGKDINLDGKDQIAVAAKLIVENAHNVKVSSNKFAAIFARDDTSTINCTGKVDIRSDENMAVNGSLNIYNSSEVTLSAGNSVVTGSANITSDGDVTIESTDGRAAQKLTINKAEDVTISISDAERAVSEETKITASGTVTLKNNAQGGRVGTVDFTQADGKKYVYYTSEAEDAKLIDPRIHPLAEAAGSSYLRIEPRETYYSITVANGTAQVGDDTTGQITTAFEGETVTVKANAPTDEDAAKGVKFHHWKVEEGSANIAPTAGSLGSATEAGTEEISFDMPKGDVKLTAVYSIPASVLRSTVTVEGGTAKSTLGEGSDIPAEIGTEVKITATPYDAEKYPGMEFVEWEIVYPDSFYQKFPGGIPENLQLKLDNAKSAATTFEMPVYPVKLIAHWSASAVAGPDEPIDEDFGVEPAPMDTTGGAIAAVAVGGAAVWGGYEIATRVILHNLLPEGAAIPANRGQLALLIWTEKGKPEPAAQPAFADITDAEQAKAAQWCVEQGAMDAKGDCFEPEGWTPKFKVIEVWNKAFPKQ
ncbi:InlB B-repeat-containing protein [Faecalibacterium prausnitzii]|uniref:InlB B-repeat-containing protein n=1 Tax=Faecalibacterium TaxID=216851 RepID=UPI0032EF601A